MTVKNLSPATTLPYQLLLHSYFQVRSQSAAFGVAGLEGYDVVDVQPRGREGEGQAYYKQGGEAVTVDGEVDRIFHSPRPSNTVTIATGDESATITLSVAASPPAPVSFVVWNPHEAKALAMADFDDGGYEGMVCVEPGLIDGLQCLGGGEEQALEFVLRCGRGGE